MGMLTPFRRKKAATTPEETAIAKERHDRLRSSVMLKHCGGLPGAKQNWFLRVERRDDALVFLKGMRDISPTLATIPLSDIVGLTMQGGSQAGIRGAAGGALVGGALLGPLGMLGGAALGGGNKNTGLIVLTIKQGNFNIDVLFDKLGHDIGTTYSRLVALLKP